MTDDEMKLTFRHLSDATAATVREAFRRRAEWKKREAEAQTIPGEAVGSVRKGK